MSKKINNVGSLNELKEGIQNWSNASRSKIKKRTNSTRTC